MKQAGLLKEVDSVNTIKEIEERIGHDTLGRWVVRWFLGAVLNHLCV